MRLDVSSSGSSAAVVRSVPGSAVSMPAAAALPRQADHGSSMSFDFLWRAFARWAKITVPLSLLATGIAAAAVWLTFEPVYRAGAWFRISNPVMLAFDLGQENKGFVNTQLALVRSPLVIGRVFEQQPEIAGAPEILRQERPQEWLRSQLQVQMIGKSEFFELSFEGLEPE
ncbi:MAG: hypothetical protein N2C14_24025, partial [Planctomycetales bacterium]